MNSQTTRPAEDPRLVRLRDHGRPQDTGVGTVALAFQTDPQRDPRPAVDGVHLFHAPPEQWIELAKYLLRELDPVKKEDVPELLRWIAEAYNNKQ